MGTIVALVANALPLQSIHSGVMGVCTEEEFVATVFPHSHDHYQTPPLKKKETATNNTKRCQSKGFAVKSQS